MERVVVNGCAEGASASVRRTEGGRADCARSRVLLGSALRLGSRVMLGGWGQRLGVGSTTAWSAHEVGSAAARGLERSAWRLWPLGGGFADD